MYGIVCVWCYLYIFSVGYTGDVMEVDPVPGSLGQMTPRDSVSYGESSGNYGFEDEPPLLEGIWK